MSGAFHTQAYKSLQEPQQVGTWYTEMETEIAFKSPSSSASFFITMWKFN